MPPPIESGQRPLRFSIWRRHVGCPENARLLWGFQPIAVIASLTAVFAETYRIWPTTHSHAAGGHRHCACPRADRKRLAIGRDAGVPKGRFCGLVSVIS
jgi:hypothetical protein